MTNTLFLPGLSVSHTGTYTDDPLAVFGYKLKQERVNQSDFDPATLNHPDGFKNYNTRIEIQQPLLNMDGIYARKAVKNQYEAQSFQAKYTEQNIGYEVKKAYYQLELAATSVEVLEQSVKAAEEALKLTRQNELQGLAKKADVLEASVRLEERQDQLREAANQQQAANEYLAHLLGLGLSTQIEPVDTLLQKFPQQDLSTVSGVIENRSDLLSMQKGIEARKNMLQSQKMKFIPRVNAFGSYEWNGRKIAGSPVNNYMAGASLRWDLFSGYKNIGGVQQASAQLEEARYRYQDYLSQSQISEQEKPMAILLKCFRDFRMEKSTFSPVNADFMTVPSFKIINDYEDRIFRRYSQSIYKFQTDSPADGSLSDRRDLQFILTCPAFLSGLQTENFS